MGYKLKVNHRVESELDDAMNWYKSKQQGLEVRFLDLIKLHFKMISEYPKAFPKKQYGFRECSLSSFPYVIIYKMDGDNIIIHSVFNTNTDPSKKPK